MTSYGLNLKPIVSYEENDFAMAVLVKLSVRGNVLAFLGLDFMP